MYPEHPQTPGFFRDLSDPRSQLERSRAAAIRYAQLEAVTARRRTGPARSRRSLGVRVFQALRRKSVRGLGSGRRTGRYGRVGRQRAPLG